MSGNVRNVLAFPGRGVELTTLLVVSDVARSRDWYATVLGAEVYRDYEGSSVLRLVGHWLLLVPGGGPTEDKPTVEFTTPVDPERVSTELIFRVGYCRAAYAELAQRGADFLTARRPRLRDPGFLPRPRRAPLRDQRGLTPRRNGTFVYYRLTSAAVIRFWRGRLLLLRRRAVQSDRGLHERFEHVLVDLFPFTDIDRPAGVAFQAGVEEP